MKKSNIKTSAMILFEGKELLTARPEDMLYSDYRILRNHQTKLLRRLFPGPVKPKIQSAMGLKSGYNLHYGK